MSYTKTYTAVVPFSSSKSVRYPASEHGGFVTANVSGTVPIQIDIHVDTTSFDRSVDGTNAALAGVAAAVGAVEAAQVATINKEAQRVAQHATKEFFSIVGSEMSTRVASFSSAMKSAVGLLAEEAKSVERIHQQMEADYLAIKSRYMRIFDMLDRELDRRIKELDRPAFVISSRARGDVVQSPFEQKAAQAMANVGSSGTIASKLSCAHAKSKAANAIRMLGDTCSKIGVYSQGMGNVMADGGSESLKLQPVVYAVQRDVGSAQTHLVVQQPESSQDQEVCQKVAHFVSSCPQQSWRPLRALDQDELDAEYLRLVENYTHVGPRSGEPEDTGVIGEVQTERQRVSELMVSMYRQAHTKTYYQQ